MCANIYVEIGNVPSYSDSISNEKKGKMNYDVIKNNVREYSCCSIR